MSRHARCIKSQLRSLPLAGCSLAPPRTTTVKARRYARSALKTRLNDEQSPKIATATRASARPKLLAVDLDDPSSSSSTEEVELLTSESRLPEVEEETTFLDASTSTSQNQLHSEPESSPDGGSLEWSVRPKHPSAMLHEQFADQFDDHLDKLFPPLHFPPEVSWRILTHSSHPDATHGHNGRYSFIGRRVLESYLLLFLSSSPNLRPEHDLQFLVKNVLHSRTLGETLGSRWGLGVALRWTPNVTQSQPGKSKWSLDELKGRGLYKVTGEAVAAVIGGMFEQFGASVAHRVFHQRVLPGLALHIPKAFHQDVLRAAKSKNLLTGVEESGQNSKVLEQSLKEIPPEKGTGKEFKIMSTTI